MGVAVGFLESADENLLFLIALISMSVTLRFFEATNQSQLVAFIGVGVLLIATIGRLGQGDAGVPKLPVNDESYHYSQNKQNRPKH